MLHSYPDELAEFILKHWEVPCSPVEMPEAAQISCHPGAALPGQAMLAHLISTCYQASLMREEERTVRFRLILYEPEHLPADSGPPEGLHRLVFSEHLPFSEYELRKLAPTADFYHALIGVRQDPEKGFQIWGMIYSGQRWVQSLYGGGKTFQPLPAALVIHVTSPGRISVCKGSATVGILNAGRVVCPSRDVFDSQWLISAFEPSRVYTWGLHMKAREQQADRPWAVVQPEFFRMIKKQVIMRVIGRVRHSRHGGTIICIPDGRVDEFCSENPYADIKYRFSDEEPRRRFVTLLVELANELAAAWGSRDDPDRVVGWKEYLASKNHDLSRLDEAIFEWAHMVAGLASADGAVFMSDRFELLGFGGEISGKLGRVSLVLKALDLEGERMEPEQTGWVGTRHHSVYRLCNVLHDVIALVISRDGRIQVVRWKTGAVTCWDQVATSVMDI